MKTRTDLCAHCGFEIGIRNPSGKCDHLYYPENCTTCSGKHHSLKELLTTKTKINDEMIIKELVNTLHHLLNQPELLTDDFYRKQIKELLAKEESNV